jgi:serine/threonine protein kinase
MKSPLNDEPESDEYLAMMSAFNPGDTVLHYRISEFIGEGGMGEVYKAWDTKLGRTVAIKILPLRLGKDPVAPKRLLREARAASALNHPNIVTIYAIEESGDSAFISMEFVEGESLNARMSKGPLPLKDLINIGGQVADALAAAHEAGLIHRDVKPENIIINKNGQLKLLDFGLAKRGLDGSASIANLTQSGAISGTVCYMSPEQTHGQQLDPRTDIFSLGCVLYQASTGNLPFSGESALDIMNAINSVEPPFPGTVQTKLPQEFDVIVTRCMSKDKEGRFASARDLATALRKLSVSGNYQPLRTQQVMKKSWETKVPWIPLIAILIVALFGVFYFLRKRDRSTADVPSAKISGRDTHTTSPQPELKSSADVPSAQVKVPPQASGTDQGRQDAGGTNMRDDSTTSPQPELKKEEPVPHLQSPPEAGGIDSGGRDVRGTRPPDLGDPNQGPPKQGMSPPPHPPFFPPRPGNIVLMGTTWRMQINGGDVYFHFTPRRTVYMKADFLGRSDICGNWSQNLTSINIDVCNGSKWEGVRDGERIRWTIHNADGSTEEDVYSEQAESEVDW